jgi:hypothetical protein
MISLLLEILGGVFLVLVVPRAGSEFVSRRCERMEQQGL